MTTPEPVGQTTRSARPASATDSRASDSLGSPSFDAPLSRRAPALIRSIWADRRLGLAAAIGLALLWGLAAAWWTPRGPLTTGEALGSMLVSLALGVAAGLLMRSRWAMLVTPIAFAAAFELGRLQVSGPMVDGIHASFYGLIALVTGRGFHAVLSLLWIALGGFVGAAFARRVARVDPRDGAAGRRSATYASRAMVIAIALVFVATFAIVAQPASTDPIVDANGDELTGSVAELTSVDTNGNDLALMIRGHDTDNPVLLFLAGGPGGSEMGSMRNHLPELEEHFTVATWDQRGAGKSYPELMGPDQH